MALPSTVPRATNLGVILDFSFSLTSHKSVGMACHPKLENTSWIWPICRTFPTTILVQTITSVPSYSWLTSSRLLLSPHSIFTEPDHSFTFSISPLTYLLRCNMHPVRCSNLTHSTQFLHLYVKAICMKIETHFQHSEGLRLASPRQEPPNIKTLVALITIDLFSCFELHVSGGIQNVLFCAWLLVPPR